MEQEIKNKILGIIISTIYCVFLFIGIILVFFAEVDLATKIIMAIILLGLELMGWFIVWLNAKTILEEFRRIKKWKKF